MKKLEEWINMFSSVISYLLWCNVDIMNLRSGTAIKAILFYMTNYITKSPLKTHMIFDAIRSVFEGNLGVICGPESLGEKAWKLMTKMVNTMGGKMEIGSPMACMYLLNNPDHYTSHEFKTFFWMSYVQEAWKVWVTDPNDRLYQEKVQLLKCKEGVVGFSPVDDYIYRPCELEKMSLYDWISRCSRWKKKVHQTWMM